MSNKEIIASCPPYDFTQFPEIVFPFEAAPCEFEIPPELPKTTIESLYGFNVCPAGVGTKAKFIITTGFSGTEFGVGMDSTACCGEPCTDTLPNPTEWNILNHRYLEFAGDTEYNTVRIVNAVVTPEVIGNKFTKTSLGITAPYTPSLITRVTLGGHDAYAELLNFIGGLNSNAIYPDIQDYVTYLANIEDQIVSTIPELQAEWTAKLTKIKAEAPCWGIVDGRLTTAGYRYVTGDTSNFIVNFASAIPSGSITTTGILLGSDIVDASGNVTIRVDISSKGSGAGVNVCATLNKSCGEQCFASGTRVLLNIAESGCWEFTPIETNCITFWPYDDGLVEFPIPAGPVLVTTKPPTGDVVYSEVCGTLDQTIRGGAPLLLDVPFDIECPEQDISACVVDCDWVVTGSANAGAISIIESAIHSGAAVSSGVYENIKVKLRRNENSNLEDFPSSLTFTTVFLDDINPEDRISITGKKDKCSEKYFISKVSEELPFPDTQTYLGFNICPVEGQSLARYVLTSFNGDLAKDLPYPGKDACCGAACTDATFAIEMNLREETVKGKEYLSTAAVPVPGAFKSHTKSCASYYVHALTPSLITVKPIDYRDILQTYILPIKEVIRDAGSASLCPGYDPTLLDINTLFNRFSDLESELLPSDLARFTELSDNYIATDNWAFRGGKLTSGGLAWVKDVDAETYFAASIGGHKNLVLAYPMGTNVLIDSVITERSDINPDEEGLDSVADVADVDNAGNFIKTVVVSSNIAVEQPTDPLASAIPKLYVCAKLNSSVCQLSGTRGVLSLSESDKCWIFTPTEQECLVVRPCTTSDPLGANLYPIKKSDNGIWFTATPYSEVSGIPFEDFERFDRLTIRTGRPFIVANPGVEAECPGCLFWACLESIDGVCQWKLTPFNNYSVGDSIHGFIADTGFTGGPPGTFSKVTLSVESQSKFQYSSDAVGVGTVSAGTGNNLVPQYQRPMTQKLTQKASDILAADDGIGSTSDYSGVTPVPNEVVTIYAKLEGQIAPGDKVMATKIENECSDLGYSAWILQRAPERQTTFVRYAGRLDGGSGPLAHGEKGKFQHALDAMADSYTGGRDHFVAKADCNSTFTEIGETALAWLREGTKYGWHACKLVSSSKSYIVVKWAFTDTDGVFDINTAPVDGDGFPTALATEAHLGYRANADGTLMLDGLGDPIEVNVVWNSNLILTKFGDLAAYPAQSINPNDNLWMPIEDAATGLELSAYSTGLQVIPQHVSGTALNIDSLGVVTTIQTGGVDNTLLFYINEKWEADADTNWLDGYVQKPYTSAGCEAAIVVPWPCKLELTESYTDNNPVHMQDNERGNLATYAYRKEP